MPITFDPAKSCRNAKDRGMPFDMAEGFDFDTAVIRQDVRFAYPERRFQAIGRIERRTVMMVFTPTLTGSASSRCALPAARNARYGSTRKSR